MSDNCDPSFECAICWQDVAGTPTALPCCGAPPVGSTTVYCRRCLEIICEQAPGNHGRCPTCRGYYRVNASHELVVADGIDQCAVCNQPRPIAQRRGGAALCGACAGGIDSPLRYECSGCQGTQRIPHPMYRYQVDGPAAFGNNTWACHVNADCGFTKWRIAEIDVHRVPADDCPENWGTRDRWLAQVREQRLREQQEQGGAQGGVAWLRQLVGATGEQVVLGGLIMFSLWLSMREYPSQPWI